MLFLVKQRGILALTVLKVEHHVDHLTWKLPTVWAYSVPDMGVGVRPFCFTNPFLPEVKP